MPSCAAGSRATPASRSPRRAAAARDLAPALGRRDLDRREAGVHRRRRVPRAGARHHRAAARRPRHRQHVHGRRRAVPARDRSRLPGRDAGRLRPRGPRHRRADLPAGHAGESLRRAARSRERHRRTSETGVSTRLVWGDDDHDTFPDGVAGAGGGFRLPRQPRGRGAPPDDEQRQERGRRRRGDDRLARSCATSTGSISTATGCSTSPRSATRCASTSAPRPVSPTARTSTSIANRRCRRTSAA